MTSKSGVGVLVVLVASLTAATAHGFAPLAIRFRAAQIHTPPAVIPALSLAAPAPATTQAPTAFTAQMALPIADARAWASEGRRLMNEGHLLEARQKLRQAVAADATADPEWVFDLGHCAERLHRDDEALDAFRKYLKLPLTLRAAEAERRIAAIEERRKPPASDTDEPKTAPRYVLVPTKADKGKCVRSCDASSVCGRFIGKAGEDQCEAARFSCFRNCAGARVSRGLCPQPSRQEPAACLPDRRGWAAPGLITPLRY